MVKLIDSNGEPYELIRAHRRRDDQAMVGFLDEGDAFTFLRRLAEDELNRAALRRFAVDYGLIADMRGIADRRLLKILSTAIQSGRLMAVRPGEWKREVTSQAPSHKTGEPAPPPEKEAPPPTTEKTWIKFEILDDATGKPVSGVTLKVKLPDGESRNATSNSAGIIEITNIPPGTCDIERMIDSDTLEVVSIQ